MSTARDSTPINPTRLVDTRSGIGGSTISPVAANGTYTLTSSTPLHVTTATTPTIAVITGPTADGNATPYPTSNVNWGTGDTLALTPTSSDRLSY